MLSDELRDCAWVYKETGNEKTRVYDLLVRAADEIERMALKPASENPVWSEWYLVICNEPGRAKYRIAAWGNDGWYEEDGGFLRPISEHVVWWCPLPEYSDTQKGG